jgi:hypothetical protein
MPAGPVKEEMRETDRPAIKDREKPGIFMCHAAQEA